MVRPIQLTYGAVRGTPVRQDKDRRGETDEPGGPKHATWDYPGRGAVWLAYARDARGSATTVSLEPIAAEAQAGLMELSPFPA